MDMPTRTPTFVELPQEWWLDEWFHDGSGRFLCKSESPHCRLLRALYGHPVAGALREATWVDIMKNLVWVAVQGSGSVFLHTAILPALTVKCSMVHIPILILHCPLRPNALLEIALVLSNTRDAFFLWFISLRIHVEPIAINVAIDPLTIIDISRWKLHHAPAVWVHFVYFITASKLTKVSSKLSYMLAMNELVVLELSNVV